MRIQKIAAAAVVCLAAGACFAGDPPIASVSLSALKDNTLYQSTTGALSNGIGGGFFAGRTNQANNSIRRGLIAFDLSGIPAGAAITSVTLRLVLDVTNSGAVNIGTHRLLNNWGESGSDAGQNAGGSGVPAESGDATWLHKFSNTQLWSSPGGDFSATASATTSVDNPGVYLWSSAALLADVQAWQNEPAANNGWLIRGDESTAGSAKRFWSRQAQFEQNRPSLIIEYVIPTPNALGLMSVAGLAAARRRR